MLFEMYIMHRVSENFGQSYLRSAFRASICEASFKPHPAKNSPLPDLAIKQTRI